ncbi:MAG TPA: Rieske (2Fe-2S) protein [Ktedonobacterales bacterium]|nr:Rieske (2Fe-2S) protein [Ktedonobacterales bacterium]
MADSLDSNTTRDTPTGGAPGSAASTTPSDTGHPARPRTSRQLMRRQAKDQQWRDEFPYHWSADDLVTRRDTLRFLVAGSSALLVASAALAVVGSVRSSTNMAVRPVARVGELGINQWKMIDRYPDQYAQGILVNLPGNRLVAYSDVCTHLSCAVLYQPDKQHFYCPCHDGLFDAYSGNVLAGPPTRPLPIIQLVEHNGIIYAVQETER